MDAHRREVFAALYRVTDGAAVRPGAARRDRRRRPSDSPAATLARWWSHEVDVPAVFIGDGAVLYAKRSRATPPRVVPPPLLAGAIGRLAVSHMRRGGAMRPGGRASAVRPAAGCGNRAGERLVGTKVAVAIQPVTSRDQIDEVLAIEEASFTNPWTREMYLAELENQGVSFCFLATTPSGTPSASARSGACSTSCTSTTWRCSGPAPRGRRQRCS